MIGMRRSDIGGVWGRRMAICAILLLMLAGAGCMQFDVEYGRKYDLVGRVMLGPLHLLMDTGEVNLYGPVNRTAELRYNGTFSLANLPAGQYNLQVTTPAGNASQQFYLSSDKSVDVVVSYPSDLDQTLFLDISGIWNIVADPDDMLLTRVAGYNMRWRNGATVPVYIAEGPAGSSPANAIWNYASGLPVLYGNRVTFNRTYSTSNARIEVQSVPAGDLGWDMAGMAQIVQSDNQGYFDKILCWSMRISTISATGR